MIFSTFRQPLNTLHIHSSDRERTWPEAHCHVCVCRAFLDDGSLDRSWNRALVNRSLPAQQTRHQDKNCVQLHCRARGWREAQLQMAKTTTFSTEQRFFQSVSMIACHSAACTRKMATLGNHNYQKIRLECHQVAIDRNRSMASQRVKVYSLGRETPDFFFLTAQKHDESWLFVHVNVREIRDNWVSHTQVGVKS